MALINSCHESIDALMKAFGIDTNHVRSFKLIIESDDVVRIELKKFVTDEEMEGAKEVVKKYGFETVDLDGSIEKT